MSRLDLFFFGYFKYTIRAQDTAKCAAMFLKEGINARFVDGTFVIKSKERQKVDSLLDGRIEYKRSFRTFQ